MILQIIGLIALGAGVNNAVKGFKTNEEEYLQSNLNWEKWFEEEKRAEYEIETIQHRRSRYKRCFCQEASNKEKINEAIPCFYHQIFKYAHWLREKLTSTEVQKEELKTLVENVRAIQQVVESTYQHEKAEWELNNLKETGMNEDYEIIDKGIVELEQETIEWQKILTELESKLNNLQTNEQQAQIVQPAFNWNNN